MSTATVSVNTEVADTAATKPAAVRSFFVRLMDSMTRRAEQNAMARLAAMDPRLAAEIRAARDRAERECN